MTAVAPDTVALSGAAAGPKLNLFLHQVSLNPGWRNADLPARDPGGRPIANPPLAVDLHYLLTAYGPEELQAEVLLGYGMQVLHERPVLARAEIEARLPVALRGSHLGRQVELIKVTPEPMSSDELSKLWSAMQAKYRPTACLSGVGGADRVPGQRPRRATGPHARAAGDERSAARPAGHRRRGAAGRAARRGARRHGNGPRAPPRRHQPRGQDRQPDSQGRPRDRRAGRQRVRPPALHRAQPDRRPGRWDLRALGVRPAPGQARPAQVQSAAADDRARGSRPRCRSPSRATARASRRSTSTCARTCGPTSARRSCSATSRCRPSRSRRRRDRCRSGSRRAGRLAPGPCCASTRSIALVVDRSVTPPVFLDRRVVIT